MENYINEKNFDAFEEMYIFAAKEKQITFNFKGQEILTSYAKYVCEYVNARAKV
ncbi:MAG: hypothetical protein JRJ39_02850 [Deltaproteobacteria bacterium]|nr:hypothetical protein [Deltaproteobacteria bacterium]